MQPGCVVTLRLFTGKGGVGKSTVVASLALAAADAGQTPLVVELGHRATMESLFRPKKPIDFTPRDIGHGVFAMNMVATDAIEDYVATQVRIRALARRIVRQTTLAALLHAAPAVTEVVTLDKLDRLRASGRFDPILVDLDATGHAMMFLSLPQVFEGLAKTGPLAELLERTTSLLRDPSTVLHLVGLPAPLPAQELLELDAALSAGPRVRLGSIVLNRMPAPAPAVDYDALREDFPVEVAVGERAALRRTQAEAAVAQVLARIDRPMVVLDENPAFHAGADHALLRATGAELSARMFADA